MDLEEHAVELILSMGMTKASKIAVKMKILDKLSSQMRLIQPIMNAVTDNGSISMGI